MIYFILKTNFLNSLSYQTYYQNFPNSKNTKEFNCFKTTTNSNARLEFMRSRPIERSEIGLLLAPAGRDGYGCDSVVVSIEACGALGPGSSPGRGPRND